MTKVFLIRKIKWMKIFLKNTADFSLHQEATEPCILKVAVFTMTTSGHLLQLADYAQTTSGLLTARR